MSERPDSPRSSRLRGDRLKGILRYAEFPQRILSVDKRLVRDAQALAPSCDRGRRHRHLRATLWATPVLYAEHQRVVGQVEEGLGLDRKLPLQVSLRSRCQLRTPS